MLPLNEELIRALQTYQPTTVFQGMQPGAPNANLIQRMSPAPAMSAPSAPDIGPTMANSARAAEGPTRNNAKMFRDPKPKDGGMWDAMLLALAAGIGAAPSGQGGAMMPGGADVGGGQTPFKGLGLYGGGGGNFNSTLARALLGGG